MIKTPNSITSSRAHIWYNTSLLALVITVIRPASHIALSLLLSRDEIVRAPSLRSPSRNMQLHPREEGRGNRADEHAPLLAILADLRRAVSYALKYFLGKKGKVLR